MIVAPRQPRADKSLVVPQVQVRLGPVFGDKDLAVLKRAHGARIDVDIGVELEMGDADGTRFENRAQ